MRYRARARSFRKQVFRLERLVTRATKACQQGSDRGGLAQEDKEDEASGDSDSRRFSSVVSQAPKDEVPGKPGVIG